MKAPSVSFTLLKTVRVSPRLYNARDLEAIVGFVYGAEKVKGTFELTLDLTGPDRIHSLNRHYRGVDRSTDVISFLNEAPPRLQGDIAINVAQAGEQAKKMRHPHRRELRLLWIHGLLHLLGYTDYEPVLRRRMFKRQNELLRRWEKKHP